MQPLFGLNPEVANTIITAIALLLSALLGGLIAARATKKATERALSQSLVLQNDTRRETLRGVLLGIQAELGVVLEIYRIEMEPEISDLKPGEGVWTTLPIYEKYFTVYESNCEFLGQIPDDELREAIIRAYMMAKSLINAHKLNNQLIANHNQLEIQNAPAFMIARAKNEVLSYGPQIQMTYREAAKNAEHCLKLIKASDLAKVSIGKTGMD
jgi:hypothetical protein